MIGSSMPRISVMRMLDYPPPAFRAGSLASRQWVRLHGPTLERGGCLLRFGDGRGSGGRDGDREGRQRHRTDAIADGDADVRVGAGVRDEWRAVERAPPQAERGPGRLVFNAEFERSF